MIATRTPDLPFLYVWWQRTGGECTLRSIRFRCDTDDIIKPSICARSHQQALKALLHMSWITSHSSLTLTLFSAKITCALYTTASSFARSKSPLPVLSPWLLLVRSIQAAGVRCSKTLPQGISSYVSMAPANVLASGTQTFWNSAANL